MLVVIQMVAVVVSIVMVVVLVEVVVVVAAMVMVVMVVVAVNTPCAYSPFEGTHDHIIRTLVRKLGSSTMFEKIHFREKQCFPSA